MCCVYHNTVAFFSCGRTHLICFSFYLFLSRRHHLVQKWSHVRRPQRLPVPPRRPLPPLPRLQFRLLPTITTTITIALSVVDASPITTISLRSKSCAFTMMSWPKWCRATHPLSIRQPSIPPSWLEPGVWPPTCATTTGKKINPKFTGSCCYPNQYNWMKM